jgi:DUF1680 family protein
MKAVGHTQVAIESGFWARRLATIRDVTLWDVFRKFELARGDAFANFDRVAAGEHGAHVGFPFFDGLLYETIRGASDLLAVSHDERLDRQLDGYIERIARAQAVDPDGYLNTFTTLLCPDKRWGENGGNLRWQHEVYNAGCLVEAAVHHYQATRKRNLLDVAVRLADHMCGYMGPSPRKNIVPAHPLPEEAFVKLYRLFRDTPDLRKQYPQVAERRYLELARFWIDNRGNHTGRANCLPNLLESSQDHEPLLKQREAAGHSVKAGLLYTGLVAVAQETGRRKYYRAAMRIWENAVSRKMHVTGGVGAMHQEEAYGPDYFLPDDAYLETCAGVAMAFWNHRMGLAFGEARFADIFERVLYNNVLGGLSLDGTRFFYQNPLVSKGDLHRWDWHVCPCCPPMILKLLSGLGGYIYAHQREAIFVNHYVESTTTLPLEGDPLSVRQETQYPWEGRVQLGLDPQRARRIALHLRIPDWCPGFTVSVNGAAVEDVPLRRGYAVIQRVFSPGDRVVLDMRMPVMLIEANPYVEAARGRVAIQRGPLVYCLEEVDNEPGVDITLPERPALEHSYRPELLGGIVEVRGKALDGKDFRAVPYFTWGNRTPASPCGQKGPLEGGQIHDKGIPLSRNQMRVWVRRDGDWDPSVWVWRRPDILDGWDGLLYRPLAL